LRGLTGSLNAGPAAPPPGRVHQSPTGLDADRRLRRLGSPTDESAAARTATPPLTGIHGGACSAIATINRTGVIAGGPTIPLHDRCLQHLAGLSAT
ncbi:hypothetical protein ABT173_42970, partial [Streptomyces sp. NPDC001795]